MRPAVPPFVAAALALAVQGAALGPVSAAPAGPSFDCSRVTAAVNRMICASPSLSAADRSLGETFDTIVHQGGVDEKAIRADEARWLGALRNACADAPCLARVYAEREAALRRMSQRAASPAAYDETRPFPAPPAVLAQARARIGVSCAPRPGANEPPGAFPGFTRPRGFLPINFNGGYVQPLQHGGVRFAFLLMAPGPDLSHCRVADVVVLPPPRPREAFRQGRIDAVDSYGFGMRQDGKSAVVAYWSIDAGRKTLRREPVGVLGGPTQVRCQEPETGD